MGKRPQPRLRIDALTGEWQKGEAGEGQGSEPCESRGLRHQAGVASWRAPRGRKASSTRKIKPQTSDHMYKCQDSRLKDHTIVHR